MEPGHRITPRIRNILHFRQLGSPVRFALALALVMPICRIKKSVTVKIEFAHRQLPESAMVKEGNSHSLTTLAKPVLNAPASLSHALLSRESRASLPSPSKSPIKTGHRLRMFFEMDLGLSLSFRVRTVKRGAGNRARRSKIILPEAEPPAF
jgi:hypothetical protein